MQARTLLLILFFLSVSCSVTHAATLNITVQDNSDGSLIGEAMIYANGEFIGKTGESGPYTFSHSLNESIRLTVTKNGYEDWVDLVSPTQASVLVQLSRRSESLTIFLYDAATLDPVENALVLLSGEGYSASAATDAAGKASFAVKTSATLTMEARAQHFDILHRTIRIDTGSRVVQFWLFRSDQFVIQVQDAATLKPIPDAAVTVGSLGTQKTDAAGRLLLYLDRERQYTITVEKADYQQFSQRRLITIEDAVFTALLSKSTYPVFLSVFDESRSPVEGADIYLNGTLRGKSDLYGRFGLADLEAGPHSIEVRRAGYVPWSDVIGTRGQSEDIVAVLGFGTANLTSVVEDVEHSKVAGATVSIDGRGVGITDSLGNCITEVKTRGTYNVSATKQGYQPGFVQEEVPLGTAGATATIVLARIQDFTLLLLASAGLIAVVLIILGVRHLMQAGRRGHGQKKNDI